MIKGLIDLIHSQLASNAVFLLKDKITMIKKENEFIYLVGPIQLPVDLFGNVETFQWYCWLKDKNLFQSTEEIINYLSSTNLADFQQSSVITFGNFKESENAMIRFHSICHTGDIFGSMRCDCGNQLRQSMKLITEHGTGAIFYLANHEGRGIGLFSKALAYVLQEHGFDTVEANEMLGFSDDIRNYQDAIAVLKELRQKPVNLITNNPKKVNALKNAGLQVAGRTPLWGNHTKYNEHYLNTKVNKSGHLPEKDCLM